MKAQFILIRINNLNATTMEPRLTRQYCVKKKDSLPITDFQFQRQEFLTI